MRLWYGLIYLDTLNHNPAILCGLEKTTDVLTIAVIIELLVMPVRPVFSNFLRMSISRTSTYCWLQRRFTISILL
jgi:hypothetical protein